MTTTRQSEPSPVVQSPLVQAPLVQQWEPSTVLQAPLPDAPPADRVSSARQKRTPNWALKTVMAVTGTLLAVILVVGLVARSWLFGNVIRAHNLAQRGDPGWVAFANRINNSTDRGLMAFAVIALVLIIVHLATAVLLVRRPMAGRGAIPAWRFGGLRVLWARSMPFTGAAIAVCVVVFLVWPVTFGIGGDASGCAGAAGSCPTWVSLTIAFSTIPPWLSLVLYIIELVATGLHVMRGLSTVATIAAGNNVLLGQVKRWVLIVGGAVFVLLLVAQLMLPLAAWRGWF